MQKALLLILCGVLLIGCASVSVNEKKEAQAYYQGGTAALVEGDYTVALERLLKAVKINPEDPYGHNNLALTYQVKKLYDKAEFHFKRALELKEDFPDAQNNLGVLYLKKKQWKKAVEYCMKAAKNPLYRTPEKAYANVGRAYYGMKDYRKAIKYQRKAITIDREFCYAYTSLGQAQMRSKKYDRASKSLKKAINICKTYEAPYYVLGLNYIKARKKKQAIKQFNVLLRRFPEGKYQVKAKKILKVIKKTKR